MGVRIVAITKPLVDGIETAEDFIAYAARVSNPSNQMNTETAPRLVEYLMDNQHWSPLEMVSITMEINTTRDIARQMLRHRSFSFQEFSQRYADVRALGDMFELRELRLQDKKNRQNSIENTDVEFRRAWEESLQEVIDQVTNAYEWALQQGIAKEQARVVLPEGLTKSRLYMAGTFRSWYHYCQLRSKESGTQKEHYLIADKCWKELGKHFPSIIEV